MVLRKIEAKGKRENRPWSPWIRRTLVMVGLCGALWATLYVEVKLPEDFPAKSTAWLNRMEIAKTSALDYLLQEAGSHSGRTNIITVSN
ncbi:hypothetical protein TCAL_11930 [Tigriopus californicus]|uniref:Uncharacterized protein n=1 Tax=Tigriopus californicus TaxID=6832 RepID=A0A553NZ70_TIGCA|nr:hypothetical protein TCAL_11930 [Tigriopus californicus]